MESQNLLYKIFNILLPFTDFTYLLQQEEYSLQRFNNWFWRFFFKRNIEKRDSLKYTQRAKMIISLSMIVWVGFLIILWSERFLANLLVLIVSLLLIPIFVIISNSILSPIYELLKKRIIKKAKINFDKKRGHCKVIAITGSFGKTTVKNYLFETLRYKYKTLMVPGNINSTIGIANWIVNNFKEETDILITEVDSYKKGRIKNATEFLNPNIAIITNIGDQHLERFKTKEKLGKTLYEIFKFSQKDCLKLTTKETSDYLKSISLDISDIKIIEKYNKSNLSEKDLVNIGFVKEVCSHLEVLDHHSEYVIENKLQAPDRRQKEIIFEGFSAIDDSYNISLTTAKIALEKALSKAKELNKKLLVITAGIAELGEENKDSNRKLGVELRQAHKVYLLESIFYKEIVLGGAGKGNFVLVKDFTSAKEKIKVDLNPADWFVLIHPELTDLYY